MKKIVRLNEQDINRIVGECVNRTLNKSIFGKAMLGRDRYNTEKAYNKIVKQNNGLRERGFLPDYDKGSSIYTRSQNDRRANVETVFALIKRLYSVVDNLNDYPL